MEICPLRKIGKVSCKSTFRTTAPIREEIIRKSFELFKSWHGKTYSEMIKENAWTANAAPRGITSAAVEVCAGYDGMSHNQRYHLLEAVSGHAYVRQEKVLNGTDIELSWNPSRRRYDKIYPSGCRIGSSR